MFRVGQANRKTNIFFVILNDNPRYYVHQRNTSSDSANIERVFPFYVNKHVSPL